MAGPRLEGWAPPHDPCCCPDTTLTHDSYVTPDSASLGHHCRPAQPDPPGFQGNIHLKEKNKKTGSSPL